MNKWNWVTTHQHNKIYGCKDKMLKWLWKPLVKDSAIRDQLYLQSNSQIWAHVCTHVVATERQIEMTDGEKLGNEVVVLKKNKKKTPEFWNIARLKLRARSGDILHFPYFLLYFTISNKPITRNQQILSVSKVTFDSVVQKLLKTHQ